MGVVAPGEKNNNPRDKDLFSYSFLLYHRKGYENRKHVTVCPLLRALTSTTVQLKRDGTR